jgi:hypothetical protein
MARIVGIAIQSGPQHAILIDHTIKKEWETDRHEKCGGEP